MAVNINVPSQVKTYANLAAFPATGALKTIYIAEDTNKTYRWTGSVYTEISASAAMTWGAIGGTLSNQTDLQSALDAKVPTSRTLTINGVTQDLSADRTFTISTGITIGSTAIASGVVGRVLFEGAGNVVQESSSLFWDATNNRLGIGTSSPATLLNVSGNYAGTTDALVPQLLFENTNNTSSAYLAAIIRTRISTGYVGNFPELWIQSTRDASNVGITMIRTVSNHPLSFHTNDLERARIFANGNVAINTTTDAGFKLDVNGTARVQGNTTVSLNQNGQTLVNVSNTTAGTNSRVDYVLTSDVNSGQLNFGKFSTNTTPYKSIASKDAFLFNNAAGGDIALHNEFATGRIKFAAGGASTAQMTLFSTGNLGINTTTDAGFRLDVNGTARFVNSLRLDTEITPSASAYTNGPLVSFVTSSGWSSGRRPGISFWGQSNSGAFLYYDGSLTFRAINDAGLSMTFASTAYVLANQPWVISGSNISYTTGNVLIGTTTNVASAIVNVDSTTKGFLPPRMTTTQKNAIASPAAGLMVYDTTLNVISYYNGSMWI